jgi:pilus assembly protein TadC
MIRYSKLKGEAMLKRKLLIAGMNITPKDFVKKNTRTALMVAVCMGVLSFFIVSKNKGSPIMILLVAFMFFMLSRSILNRSADVKISKRAKAIDKDVLFAGRFLLIKLNSGKPLINSLIEASQSYGVASHYFKEIVRNIELGTPLEQALESAMDNCPSKKMKKILFQINNALKVGVDVSQNLESILQEITNEQLVEIQRYGKKLNSLTMFYMLLAVVVPSLGITIFVILASLVSISLPPSIFISFLFFLTITELMFMSIFKSIRPSVNI